MGLIVLMCVDLCYSRISYCFTCGSCVLLLARGGEREREGESDMYLCRVSQKLDVNSKKIAGLLSLHECERLPPLGLLSIMNI